ncbi:MAG: hypothetical protein WCE75_06880 [Terracidiphilus sp.]
MISAFKTGRDRRNEERDSCATGVDFLRLFAEEGEALFQLSLELTADSEKAELCLVSALKGCLRGGPVPKKRARIWARRMVVRHAIRLVAGREDDIGCETDADICLQPSQFRVDGRCECQAILELPDFDRLAFAICVLERYSVLDAALLLRRTPKDVNDAIERATREVVPDGEWNLPGTIGQLALNPCLD